MPCKIVMTGSKNKKPDAYDIKEYVFSGELWIPHPESVSGKGFYCLKKDAEFHLIKDLPMANRISLAFNQTITAEVSAFDNKNNPIQDKSSLGKIKYFQINEIKSIETNPDNQRR